MMTYGYDIGREPKNDRSRAAHRTNFVKNFLVLRKAHSNWSYNEVLLYVYTSFDFRLGIHGMLLNRTFRYFVTKEN